MTQFCVWAPKAGSVQLALGERRLDMHPKPGGWWHFCEPELPSSSDYAYIVDGSQPLPDPRSPWQPYGINGPSRTLDHEAFEWTDHRWQPPPLSSAIIYELHVGTFTRAGTFEGAIERLDHLVDLGVTHVELMPVGEFSGYRGWGYDGVDLYAPCHAYGGPHGLKRLVDACHARGLAVLLDVVYNHLGPAGNYLDRFGPYFTTTYSTPWGPAINMDEARSDEVRRFLIDNALMWLRDYHFDGLRLDAIHAMFDRSAVHFLEELRESVKRLEAQLGRHLVLIAESDLNDPRIVRPRAAGGYGMDAQWSDDFHHALHCALTGERAGYYADFGTLAQLAKALEQAFVYDGIFSVHRQRRHGRRISGLSGHRFLAYLQNHDQIGNRAQGERIGQLISAGRARIGAALVLTSPFIPLLFQGEEWAAGTPFQYFTDHGDPALGQAVTQGRRKEFAAFGWKPESIPDPQGVSTFERSRLDWSELERPAHAQMLEWYRHLIRLRRSFPMLTDGRLDAVRPRFDEQNQWLTVQRGRVTVACNFADQQRLVPFVSAGTARIMLMSNIQIALCPEGLKMVPESVAILDTGGGT